MRASVLFLALLLGGAFGFSPMVAHAQAVAEKKQTEAECAKLRTQLERLNAEISAMKQREGGLRNSYRLRDKMAESEALARQLTAAESRLRSLGGNSVQTRLAPGVVPAASPLDGAVELEAKADLLSDQASRLAREADGLARAATEIRNRRLLRRHGSQWDRDPFAGFESSKRTLSVGGGTRTTAETSGTKSATGEEPTPVLTPPQSEDPTRSPTSSPTPSVDTSNKSPTPTTGETATVGSSAVPDKAGPTPVSLLPNGTAAGAELHVFLDPATAAELRNLLGSTGRNADPEALARAARLLRTRAQTLDAQAKALRRQSQAP